MINFFLAWLIGYLIVYLTMSHDNIWWMDWTGLEWVEVKSRRWGAYLRYVFKDRLWTVFKAKRDVYPAIISSLGMALWVSFGLWGWAVILIISAMILKTVHLKLYG